MSRLSSANSITGNVFMWRNVHAGSVGASYDFALTNTSTNTKTGKIFGINAYSDVPLLITSYKNVSSFVGGTTAEPFNVNFSTSAATNTLALRYITGGTVGGSLIAFTDRTVGAVKYGLETDPMDAHPEICFEIPPGQGFKLRIVPQTTAGTLITGLTWSEQ